MPTLRQSFAPRSDSPRVARRFAAAALEAWGVHDPDRHVEMVVTELAAEAIEDTGDVIDLTLHCSAEGRVTVQVSSSGTRSSGIDPVVRRMRRRILDAVTVTTSEDRAGALLTREAEVDLSRQDNRAN